MCCPCRLSRADRPDSGCMAVPVAVSGSVVAARRRDRVRRLACGRDPPAAVRQRVGTQMSLTAAAGLMRLVVPPSLWRAKQGRPPRGSSVDGEAGAHAADLDLVGARLHLWAAAGLDVAWRHGEL